MFTFSPVPITEPIEESDETNKRCLPPKDKRVLAFNLKRLTKRDCSQVEFNPITSYLLRCNTSIQFLMTTTAAKNSIYYIANYMSKHPLQLTNALSLVYGAMLSAKKYGSKAPDAGTEKEMQSIY